MNSRKVLISCLFISIIAGFISVNAFLAHAKDVSFLTYGSGAVQVRIYSDFFCPPCRGMKPAVEPVLRNLLKRNIITLTMVDTPFYRYSALYARYFLYAMQAKDDFEHSLMVRNTLFEATDNRHITTEESIEELFRRKKIPFTAFDPKPVFDRFHTLLKEDKINATPSCVIVRGGKKETFVGSHDIVNALKRLQ